MHIICSISYAAYEPCLFYKIPKTENIFEHCFWLNWIYLWTGPKELLKPVRFCEKFLYWQKIIFDVNKKFSFPSCVTHGSKSHQTTTKLEHLTCMIQNRIKYTDTQFALAQTAMVPDIFFISWTRGCKIASSAR